MTVIRDFSIGSVTFEGMQSSNQLTVLGRSMVPPELLERLDDEVQLMHQVRSNTGKNRRHPRLGYIRAPGASSHGTCWGDSRNSVRSYSSLHPATKSHLAGNNAHSTLALGFAIVSTAFLSNTKSTDELNADYSSSGAS
ncbi:uncharacterized protein LOC111250188 isoform X1 [Varroa destructor]|uniref:Uncharacterized protein n=1 Tax=Varroa destructor TaxID=109461 RepID=A0A7M7K4W5_VARDE|nr:uncharacterized protein LOC111250188 isoform X1 [Varroa destructor]XP_022660761.1 uncharacterized protein LOC111250188 isoform X1 [Varroa destructor]XP_022660762.1 uncharacterized protein LOC111250188 isoform X1 [Varroa destructor]